MAYGFMWESEAVPELSRAWYRQWLLDAPVPHDHDEPEWMFRVRVLPWLSAKERDQELEKLFVELEPKAKTVARLYCVDVSLTAGDTVRAVSLLAQEKPRELHGALFDQSRILVARLHADRVRSRGRG